MTDSHEQGENSSIGPNKPPEAESTPPYCTAIEGRDPFTGKIWPVYIRDKTLETVGKRRQRGFALELGRIVPETVLNPSAVFRGVTDYDREDGEDDWLIYVSRPAWAFEHGSGRQLTPWKGAEIFLVFFDGDRILRMPWSWDASDPTNERLPIGFNDGRFKERLL